MRVFTPPGWQAVTATSLPIRVCRPQLSIRLARTPTRLAADPELGNLRAEFWVDEAATTCRFRDPTAIDALWARCVEMTHTNV